jgi:hypothetical protein
MAKIDLDKYVTVAERLVAFYEKFPEGSIRSEILQDDGKRVVMRAQAYRRPDDEVPAIGHAEEVRGDGPVNRTSAIENCETSAAGRALAMLGFEVTKGIASREEVEQAQAEEQRQKAEGNGKPETVGKTWADNARSRIVDFGIDLDEAKMKLTTFNVERLEELTPTNAAHFDAWLSDKAEKANA